MKLDLLARRVTASLLSVAIAATALAPQLPGGEASMRLASLVAFELAQAQAAEGDADDSAASDSADAASKKSMPDEPIREMKSAEPGSDSPWAEGVSREDQSAARKLFYEGNALLHESFFQQAVEKYEEALAHWNHPGIHYNLSLALLSLNQPVRLRGHLIGATEYGADPVGEDKYDRALKYLAIVEEQLSLFKVHCNHEGARVEVDGEFAFTGPGKHEIYVRPGRHSATAIAQGYETSQRSFVLEAGKALDVEMKLYKPEDWIRYRRRWNVWMPIAVTGAGVLVAAAGGVVYWKGIDTVRDFDREVTANCTPNGCQRDELQKNDKTGEALQAVGLATMGVGAAAVITGGILLYMNRKTPYRVDPSTEEELSFAPQILPIFSPGFAGISAQGTF